MTTPPPTPELIRFPCQKCGAKLEYAPGTTVLKCVYCAHENTIQNVAPPVEELDFHEHLRRLEEAEPHDSLVTIKCDTCAAEVKPPPNITSFACCFCGSNIVAKGRECRVIRPTGVLPFKIGREEAVSKFKTWIASLWWAPNALKKRAMVEAAVTGLYLPAWTFDARMRTQYRGQRGDAYYDTQWVTVNGRRQTQRVRKIRWTSVAGEVPNIFDDLLVLASKSLPERLTQNLDPWDTEAIQPYEEAYLAGFSAERYQVELHEGFQIAERMMQPQIEHSIRSDIGGDEQRIEFKQTRYLGITFKHVLLPVWISSYRYSGTVYRFLVNARTGEVQGDRPYSATKIVLAIVGALAVVLIVIVLFVKG